jgi:hypothetical protein
VLYVASCCSSSTANTAAATSVSAVTVQHISRLCCCTDSHFGEVLLRIFAVEQADCINAAQDSYVVTAHCRWY